MNVLITGDTALYRRLNSLSGVIKKSFWIEVQEDFEKNLLANVKPHTKPGGSGNLERNVYVDIIPNGVEGGIRDTGMLVSWNGGRINYASFIIHGTRDHDITPKNKKALRWNSPGGFAFSKGHRVRGIKKDDFLMNSAQETFKKLDSIFKKELQKHNII